MFIVADLVSLNSLQAICTHIQLNPLLMETVWQVEFEKKNQQMTKKKYRNFPACKELILETISLFKR